MLNEVQTWWNDVTPENRVLIWDIGIGLAAFIGGLIAGAFTRRTLRSWNFDAAFSVTGAPPPGGEPGREFTPTRAAALLVRLTVWATAGWWFAARYGRPDISDWLVLVGGRIWALIATLSVVLVVGGLLSRRVAESLQGPLQSWNGVAAPRNGAAPSRGVAGAIGAGVYVLVVLLTLLAVADIFDWPLSRTAATALWQLTQQLLTAAAALLLAFLGARWARDLAVPAGPLTPVQKAAQYVGLALVAGTTMGGVAALLTNRGILVALAALPILAFLVWVARIYLPDLVAGRKLRADKVGQVWIEGAACRVAGVGLLTAEVGQGNDIGRVPNRLVLEAAEHGPPVANGRR